MTDRDSARAALRAATAHLHQQVDDVFSQADLSDRASYGRFLCAQAAAHVPVEQALAAGGVAGIVTDWSARCRADLLRDDLAALGLEPPAPAGGLTLDGPAAMLGALYVLEGSRLGGALLRRSVPADFPARFLGGADSAAWRNLLRLLDDRLDTTPKRLAAVRAACDVFRLFEVAGRDHLGLHGIE